MIVKCGKYISGGWIQAPWPTSGYFRSEQACVFTLANPSSPPTKLLVKESHVNHAGFVISTSFWALGTDLAIYNNANTNTHSYSNLGIHIRYPPDSHTVVVPKRTFLVLLLLPQMKLKSFVKCNIIFSVLLRCTSHLT